MKNIIRKAVSVLAAVAIGVAAAVFPVSADNERQKLPDNEAMTFVDQMGAGWNLGNQFDATNCTWLTNDLDYESGWSGAKTTKELIKAVKKAGFNTIRIPVSWHDHVDKEYKINSAWMNRVKEVVDWCMDEGLYVIVNIHHDNDKNDKAYYRPSAAEETQSVKYIKTIWTQVAETFKDYSEKLIFQGMNEPRLTASDYEWWYNKDSVPDEVKKSLEVINKLNQTFVDTVRSSGGNNSKRYLLIVGYAGKNDEQGVLSPYYKLPTDKVKNRLIVDCHYYGIGVRSSLAVLDKLYDNYTSKGIPVAITEYGLNENGYKMFDNTDIATTRMTEFYSNARARGISVVVWDNNYGDKGKEGFKFFDRATAKVTLPSLVSAITKAGAPAIEVKLDTKPVVKATATANKVTLTWGKVQGAAKYAVYIYSNGSYKCLTNKLTKTTTAIKNLKSGTEYKFYVKAYVNGSWTKVTTKDIVKIKTK